MNAWASQLASQLVFNTASVCCVSDILHIYGSSLPHHLLSSQLSCLCHSFWILSVARSLISPSLLASAAFCSSLRVSVCVRVYIWLSVGLFKMNRLFNAKPAIMRTEVQTRGLSSLFCCRCSCSYYDSLQLKEIGIILWILRNMNHFLTLRECVWIYIFIFLRLGGAATNKCF